MVPVAKDCAILDVGAGTGVVGNLLKEQGFTNIVGADASDTFIKAAAASGAYKETRVLFFGMGLDKYPDDLKARFDVVTASCVWCPGHIPNIGFEDCPNGVAHRPMLLLRILDQLLKAVLEVSEASAQAQSLPK